MSGRSGADHKYRPLPAGENGRDIPFEKSGVSLRNSAVWGQLVRQTWRNIKRSKINYCLGFTACFVVVLVVSLMVTVLSKSPLIFLRLGELSNGEVDVKITPGTFVGYTRLNYTLMAELLAGEERLSHSSPRSKWPQFIFKPKCPPGANLDDPTWMYSVSQWNQNTTCERTPGGCYSYVCSTTGASVSSAYTVDSRKEREMQYGRSWNMSDDLGPGEVFLPSALADRAGYSVGDSIMLRLNISLISDRDAVAAAIFGNATNYNSTLLELIEIVWAKFTVKDIYSDPAGKLPIDIGWGMFIESQHLWSYLLPRLNPRLVTAEMRANLSKIRIEDFAHEVAINLPPPRLEQYMDSNFDNIQWTVVRFADDILYRIGFSQCFVSTPILAQLRRTRILSLFLGLILNVIIFILLFLSVVLIYSLLMISVETRTFELGILRMIGTTRRGIIALLLVQAFFYAIPALAFGLLGAQGLNFIVSWRVQVLTGADIGWGLTWQGLLWGLVMGVVIPILSSILPIRSALGMNLQDSLDTKHSKTKAVEITVERGDDTGTISMPLVLIGAGLAAFGGITYYVLPLALLSFNLSLLLNMFVFLLVGMLLGLILLALNVEHLAEHAIVWVFIWWDNAAIRSLVLKNLVAHRLRNRKTTIMYALSLGFIIFVNVAYNLQIATFMYQQQSRHGSFMTVEAGSVDGLAGKVYSIRSGSKYYLEETVKKSEIVDDACWITFDIKDAVIDYKSVSAANPGQLYSSSQYVYGVSPNFWDVMLPQFLKVSETLYEGQDTSLASALYHRNFSKHVVMGSLYKSKLGLRLDEDMVFSLNRASRLNPDQTVRETRGGKVLAFLDSSPRLTFSKYPQIGTQDIVLSLPQFLSLTNGTYASVDDLPMKFFILKLKDGATDAELDRLSLELSSSTIDADVSVWDYRAGLGPFKVAEQAMALFFNFTTVIAMLVSFFSLMSSMFTNVNEQTKEIGILRALGVDKKWMYRIYIYEAFVLVMSSSFLGMIIGYLVGYTMTLQQILFTQLPLAFDFPWMILIVVFVCSILFALAAAFSPIKSVLSYRVVQIFRLVG